LRNQDCETLHKILDSIVEGVFTVDKDYRITSMNVAAEKILGIKESEAIGKRCRDVFKADICDYSCALKKSIESDIAICNRTVHIANKEGKKIPISINASALRDPMGNIMGGVESFRDMSEIDSLRKTIESAYTFEDIVSKSRSMHEILSILPDIAKSDSSVIIQGESGTGKELIAHALHNLSDRYRKRIIPVNCAAIPDNLIESELFGYKSGAFTDAKKDKPGKIAAAQGGTLFIDELGEMSINIQVKLLRFLQDRKYEPLGSLEQITSDVRVIAATNRDLEEDVKEGRFRQDLYYRLNVINIKIPPLRERLEDIPLLVEHFISMYNVIKNREIEGVTDDVMKILLNHNFPGNIRELENIIEHAFILCKGEYIDSNHLPQYMKEVNITYTPESTLEEMEKMHILNVLERNGRNRKKTAEILGINTSTLWRKLTKYGLDGD